MTKVPSRLTLTRWPRAWHLIVLDMIAALIMTAIYVGLGVGEQGYPGYSGPVWLALVLAAGVGLPIVFRRRWPVPVLITVVSSSVIATVLGITREPYVATILVMYMVALAESRVRSVTALMAAMLAAAGSVLYLSLKGIQSWTEGLQLSVVLAAAFTVSWVIGHVTRRMRLSEMRGAEERTEMALVDERLRIAREMHDVVAHSLSVIAVKAGIANHVAEQHPDEAREALRVIETVSRGSLAEMRRMLGVLRAEGDDVEFSPAPDLSDLPGLAERARQAGVAVTFDVSGADELPEGMGLAVYRIVQEALTNVVKHAAPARCRVLVAAAGGEVRVEVVDDGPGHQTLPERFSGERGHGLAGMRERVLMYEGDFEAGRRPGGGFAVRARIPYAIEAREKENRREAAQGEEIRADEAREAVQEKAARGKEARVGDPGGSRPRGGDPGK